jgi:hypothetical protein
VATAALGCPGRAQLDCFCCRQMTASALGPPDSREPALSLSKGRLSPHEHCRAPQLCLSSRKFNIAMRYPFNKWSV